eukprot:s1491_g15.t1
MRKRLCNKQRSLLPVLQLRWCQARFSQPVLLQPPVDHLKDRGYQVDRKLQLRWCQAIFRQPDSARRRHGISTLPPLVAEYKLLTDSQPADHVDYKAVATLPNWGKLGYEDDPTGCRGTEAKLAIDVACNIPDLLTRNIASVLLDGPQLVIARRKLAVLKVKKLCLQLKADEELLHKSLDPEMGRLLEGKNLLLWKELMHMTGFDDPTLFEEVTKGFKLVGQATASPQFPLGFSSMSQTPAELRKKAIWMRKANMAKCKTTGRADLDQLVWDQTMEEQQAGWLQGPFSEDEVSQLLGSAEWLATRRFPLEQRDKTRLIDDALASGLNSAYGTSNKLTLFDIDTLVAMAIQIAHSLAAPSRPLHLHDGQAIPLKVSGAWQQPFCVLGRTLDLQSAYKQIGPYMDDKWNRVIMVFDPKSGGPRFFLSSALRFGSTAAVYAFNRGQFMGAPLKPAMQFFSKVANHGWSESLRPELAVASLYAKTVLQSEVPKIISIHQESTPILVFTDGAWEPSAMQPAGAGVVVVDSISKTKVVHEVEVPAMLLDHWKDMGKAQLIAELELLPILVFFETYKLLCQRRRVLLFVDNNAVRDATAKGTSRSLTLLILLSELYRLWTDTQCLCWVSRVPTKSNVGDFPSRQQPEVAARAIGGIVLPPLQPSSILCHMVCDASSFLDHMRNLLKRSTSMRRSSVQ